MPISNKRIATIKDEIAQGSNISTNQLLSIITSVEDLVVLREQKMFSRARNREQLIDLLNAYLATARRIILNEVELIRYVNYAKFHVLLFDLFGTLEKRTQEILLPLKSISMIELLEITQRVVGRNRIHYSNQLPFEEELKKLSENLDNSDIKVIARMSALYKKALHERGGTLNEVLFASTRALNTAIAYTNQSKRWKSGRAIIETCERHMNGLLQIANWWNSLDFAFDMVSYGEWHVSDVSDDDANVTFDIIDISLYKARQMAIRRKIVDRRYNKPVNERFLRNLLQEIAYIVVDNAIKYYHQKLGFTFLARTHSAEIGQKISEHLYQVDADDDLLLSASFENKNLQPLFGYIAAIALRCFSSVLSTIKSHVPKNKLKGMRASEIPLEVVTEVAITATTKVTNQKREDIFAGISQAVKQATIVLPVLYHPEIMHQPFIRITEDMALWMDELEDANWTMPVRTSFVRGDKTAKSYGRMWEEFISTNFEERNWVIVGRGIDVKRTDIDILAFHKGLLLVIQVKAIARGGFKPYDNWKSRETIVKGANQALIATEVLSQDERLLSSLLASKKIKTEVKRIQPLVLTTSPLFTGWVCNNVPILGGPAIVSVLQEIRVTYKNDAGQMVAMQHYTSDSSFDIDRFIGFIYNPVQWRISIEGEDIEYLTNTILGVNFNLPQLGNKL